MRHRKNDHAAVRLRLCVLRQVFMYAQQRLGIERLGGERVDRAYARLEEAFGLYRAHGLNHWRLPPEPFTVSGGWLKGAARWRPVADRGFSIPPMLAIDWSLRQSGLSVVRAERDVASQALLLLVRMHRIAAHGAGQTVEPGEAPPSLNEASRALLRSLIWDGLIGGLLEDLERLCTVLQRHLDNQAAAMRPRLHLIVSAGVGGGRRRRRGGSIDSRPSGCYSRVTPDGGVREHQDNELNDAPESRVG